MPVLAQTTLLLTEAGQPLQLLKQIASSGEGVVWETDRPGCLAKVYHQATPERIAKLRVMVANPPHDPMLRQNHISFAWPQELLRNQKGDYVGFLMPAIRDSVKLSSIYNPRLRNRKAPRFNWYYLHATALNVASVIESIHAKGYVIGDIKPQNLLVNNRALVSVIDTDSFQIVDPDTQQIYRCLVGSEGFTPPELMGRELGKLNQSEVHDRYRLGVLIYLLLFGDHPFKGKWVGAGEAPNPVELARRGYWPFGPGSLIQPGPNTVPLDVVHTDLQRCFRACFTNGHTQPDQRPSAADWSQALRASIGNLKVCSVQTNHYYSRNQLHCYWCERQQRLGIDIFDTKQLHHVVKAKSKQPRPVQHGHGALPSTARIWKMPSLATVIPKRPKPWMQQYRRELAAGGAFLMAFICLVFLIAPDWGSIYPQLRQMLKSLESGNQNQSASPTSNQGFNRSIADAVNLPPANAASTTPPQITPPQIRLLGTPRSAPFDPTIVTKASVLALSPSGDRLAISHADDAIIQVWDLQTGKLINSLKAESEPIFALGFTSNHQLMATTPDGAAQFWDLSPKSSSRVIAPMTDEKGITTAFASALSADGQWQVSRRWDQKLLFRNLRTGWSQIVNHPAKGDPKLNLTPDGKHLVSSDSSGHIWRWDIEQGRLVSYAQQHLKDVNLTRAAALSANGKLLAQGDWGGDIVLWDLAANRRWKTLTGQTTRMISNLAITANNQYLVSAGADQELRIWHLPSATFIRQLNGHKAAIRSIALSANSKILVSSSEDQTVRVWSVPEGELLHTLR
jgi:WD40 repeat protein